MKNEFEMMPESAEIKLDKLKKSLIEQAEDQYDKINFVNNKKNWDDCFTIEDGKIMFWFNTEDNSTHVLRADLPI